MPYRPLISKLDSEVYKHRGECERNTLTHSSQLVTMLGMRMVVYAFGMRQFSPSASELPYASRCIGLHIAICIFIFGIAKHREASDAAVCSHYDFRAHRVTYYFDK